MKLKTIAAAEGKFRRTIGQAGKPAPRVAFVLLEVLVSLIIISIGVTAILQSLRQSLQASNSSTIINKGVMLAQTLLEEVQVAPPEIGKYEGDFGEDEPNYRFEMKIEDEKIRYRGKDRRKGEEDFRPVRKLNLQVFYEPKRKTETPFRVVNLNSAIMGIEKFTPPAMDEYQLYEQY